MDDVIFAGTPSRPALGRAEVSLTIDNSAHLLPIEFSEVTITRSLFRTGESEYQLNGVPCRLLDLQELLSDTGIGRQQHVIVGQGQLDTILSATPDDRRAIIEEAAGILKFRRRKERAERRLVATEANLVRLQDLLREVRRQLAPLERQARAAERHGAVVDELPRPAPLPHRPPARRAPDRAWRACATSTRRSASATPSCTRASPSSTTPSSAPRPPSPCSASKASPSGSRASRRCASGAAASPRSSPRSDAGSSASWRARPTPASSRRCVADAVTLRNDLAALDAAELTLPGTEALEAVATAEDTLRAAEERWRCRRGGRRPRPRRRRRARAPAARRTRRGRGR